MKRIKQFAILLTCSASFVACSGDDDKTIEDLNNTESFMRVGTTDKNGTFTDNMNMDLNVEEGQARNLMIDLDSDGNNDLELKSRYDKNTDGVDYRATSLKPMHSDVIVLNEITNLKMVYKETPGQGGGIYKTYEDYDSTRTYDSTYVIKDRFVQRPVALKYDDRVDRASFFASVNDLMITSRDRTDNAVSQSSNLSDNHWISIDESKYMAFKLKSNNVNYEGWLKLKVSDYNHLRVESLYLRPLSN